MQLSGIRRATIALAAASVCALAAPASAQLLSHKDLSASIAFTIAQTAIETCKANGIRQAVIDFTYQELERAGRGKKADITVDFEFDSDERVSRDFEGDYFDRLR